MIEPRTTVDATWQRATYGCALILALGVSYFLWRGPLQVTDNIGNMMMLRDGSVWDVTVYRFSDGPYLRPFLWATLKGVFDLSNGHYFAAFKLVHMLQVIAVLLLAARLLRVRSFAEFGPALAALTVLVGMHTFAGLVTEGFPINTFLTIVVCCLIAVNLSESRGGVLVDVLAAATLVYAMLTVESGLLVWVCLTAAWLAGSRSVSTRGIAVCTVIFAGYFVLRFLILEGGAPALSERSSGYGFQTLEPSDLHARFGDNPIGFYLYNVLSSIATVLCAEPRAGVWYVTRSIIDPGHSPAAPWMIVNVVATTATTLLIVVYSVRRAARWLRFDVRPDERLTVVFWGVLLANAVISYPYTKDQIVTPAGVLYALAAFAALREIVRSPPPTMLRPVAAAALLVLSLAWSVKAAGLVYNLHLAAFTHRNDWLAADAWMQEQRMDVSDKSEADFVLSIKREALAMSVPHPEVVYGRLERWFDQQR